MWGEECEGQDLGNAVGGWLSLFLLGDTQAGLRLVRHRPGPSSRPDKEESSVGY